MFGLYTKMLLGIGLVFQMPTVVFFLARMEMVTARFLIKNFKIARADHLHRRGRHHAGRRSDEPDIFAAPMLGLYGISILIAWIVGPKRRTVAQNDAD